MKQKGGHPQIKQKQISIIEQKSLLQQTTKNEEDIDVGNELDDRSPQLNSDDFDDGDESDKTVNFEEMQEAENNSEMLNEVEHSRLNTVNMFTVARATVESEKKKKEKSQTSVELNPSLANISSSSNNRNPNFLS